MFNRYARLAQQCAPLLLILSLWSSSLCPAHSDSAKSLELNHSKPFKRTLPNDSKDRDALLELRAIAPGALPNGSCSVESNQASSERDYLNDVSTDGLYCWPAAKLPVKVFFQPSDGVPSYRDSLPLTLKSCFDEWTAASGGKLGWLEVSDARSADIVVQWASQAQERPEGTEAGLTRVYGQLNTATNRGIIRRVEMKLLTRLPERELTDLEVRKAYLHEVGHAFGIVGHSPNPSDIMYFAVSKRRGTHLGDRDIATINRLYSDHQPLTSLAAPSLNHRWRRG